MRYTNLRLLTYLLTNANTTKINIVKCRVLMCNVHKQCLLGRTLDTCNNCEGRYRYKLA